MEENKQGKGISIASMVLGIVSASAILLSWSIFWGFVGVATGIVGLVLGIMARKQGIENSMVKAGLILSLIGVIANTVVIVGCVGIIACNYCVAILA